MKKEMSSELLLLLLYVHIGIPMNVKYLCLTC